MAFGGFEITKHDLWKRHGGKGALRHGGTVSMIPNTSAHATEPTTSAARIAAIFRT
jgi:hypothetical protein